MGAQISQRYLRGKSVEKYFEEECWPLYGNLAGQLGLHRPHLLMLLHLWVTVDADVDGKASTEQVMAHLGMPRRILTERLVLCLSPNLATDHFEWMEFLLTTWNICTLYPATMAKFLFDIFDPDKLRVLDKPTMDAMYRLLHNVKWSEEKKVDALPYDNGVLSLGAFVEVMSQPRGFGMPLYQLQRRVRKRTGGEMFWQKIAALRQKNLSVHDQAELSATDSLRSIASVPEGAPEDKAAVAEPTSNALAEEQTALMNLKFDETHAQVVEHTKKRLEEAEALTQVSSAVKMKHAWEMFDKQRKLLRERRYSAGDAPMRKEHRERVYELFEEAREASREHWREELQRDVLQASTGDAAAKEEALRRSDEGLEEVEQRRLDQLVVIVASRVAQAHAGAGTSPAKTKSPSQEVTALLKLKVDEPRTYRASAGLKKIAQRMSTPSEREQSKVVAKEYMTEAFADEGVREAEEKHRVLSKERSRHEEELLSQLMVEFGSRRSQWEEVNDDATQSMVYVSTLSGQRLPHTAAICYECDAVLAEQDPKCFDCGAPRNLRSAAVYKPVR